MTSEGQGTRWHVTEAGQSQGSQVYSWAVSVSDLVSVLVTLTEGL